jgi:hypothetical protein
LTWLLLSLALATVMLAFGLTVLDVGLREGDRPSDTTLSAIEPDPRGRVIWLTVHNPGGQAVLVGASVRRPSLRLLCEAGAFTSAPRRTSRRGLRAGKHAVVCAIDAGDTRTVLVPLQSGGGRKAELVVAIGEADRLRVLHRAVGLPPARASARPESLRRPRRATGPHERIAP